MTKQRSSSLNRRLKSGARVPKDQGSEPLPEPGSEEFAFLVAQLAWWDGLTANAIVRQLQLPSTPQHLMQVKRALRRAHGSFLEFKPPANADLKKKLERLLNPPQHPDRTRFHVVNDSHRPSQATVASRAAELVIEIIGELVAIAEPPAHTNADESEADSQVVVCNSGGRTLAAMVRALRQRPPVIDELADEAPHRSLVFVGGNAVYLPEKFDRSANFLSVTMAELFGAKHFACPRSEDPNGREPYRKLVSRTALAICAVGSPKEGLMANHLRAQRLDLPPEAVGDLAFNLVDEHGREVDLSDKARAFMRQLNPALDLSMLQRVAANGRVLLVLDSEPPSLKAAISAATLKQGCYATDVVLGARLAKLILGTIKR